MKKYNTIIALLSVLVLIISVFPVSVLAVSENGGTVTVIYGETARVAGAVLRYTGIPMFAGGNPTEHQEDFEMGQLQPGGNEWVFVGLNDYSAEYTLLYWAVKGPDNVEYRIYSDSDPITIPGDGTENGTIKFENDTMLYYPSIADWSSGDESKKIVESIIKLTNYMYIKDDWTIEPIFAKVSPYTVYLVNNGADTVNKSDTVSLDLAVEGGAYDDLSAIITYDSDLFIYESCSNNKITVDETSNGTLKLTATGLGKDEDDEAGTLMFTAKAVSEIKQGTFTVTGAKVGTSLEAVSEDALEAKKGDSVTIGVNPATQVTIKFFNDWLGTEGEVYGPTSFIMLGNDSPDIVLENVIYEYDAENYVYTFDTQGLDYQLTTYAGRNAIKIIKPDRDLIVNVSRTAVVPGELTTRQFTVGASVYTLAIFAGTADEGNTLLYDGEQMVKTSEGYVCIIGGADTAATKTKITQETGTDLVMTVTGDVNQTGVIDINDAQLVSDLYNGKYTDGFETVAMVKYLAADVNGDGAVTATDIAAVVQNSGFVY